MKLLSGRRQSDYLVRRNFPRNFPNVLLQDSIPGRPDSHASQRSRFDRAVFRLSDRGDGSAFPAGLAQDRGRGNPWLLRAEAFTSCYFAGDLNFAPEIALDIEGTATQLAVWQALAAIPPSETRSYQQVAENIGKPRASRAVGTAVGRTPSVCSSHATGLSVPMASSPATRAASRSSAFCSSHERKCARQVA